MQKRTRLLATWAAAEGYLGGLLHAFRLPVTGLVIGSVAVAVLTRLARVPGRRFGDLTRGTGAVLVVKALLSPHSPLTAYVAVSFQGLVGELAFGGAGERPHRARAVALGAVALAESAAQKLLVLTVLFGKGLWVAVDEFLADLTHRLGTGPDVDAVRLAVAYVLAHTLVGAWVGWRAGRPEEAAGVAEVAAKVPPAPAEAVLPATAVAGPNWPLAVVGAALLGLLAWAPPWLPAHPAVRLTLRAVGLLAVWMGAVAPVLTRALRGWLLQQGNRHWATEVTDILALLPEARASLVARLNRRR